MTKVLAVDSAWGAVTSVPSLENVPAVLLQLWSPWNSHYSRAHCKPSRSHQEATAEILTVGVIRNEDRPGLQADFASSDTSPCQDPISLSNEKPVGLRPRGRKKAHTAVWKGDLEKYPAKDWPECSGQGKLISVERQTCLRSNLGTWTPARQGCKGSGSWQGSIAIRFWKNGDESRAVSHTPRTQIRDAQLGWGRGEDVRLCPTKTCQALS